MPGLPQGRIDDVLVHPRDHDLVLSTHSRSIWIMDDVTPLQQMTTENAAKDVMLFPPREAVQWKPDQTNSTEVPGDKWWEGEIAPRGTAIAYYLKTAPTGEVKVTITNTASGLAVRSCIGTANAGLNRFQWAFTADPPPGGGGAGGRGGGGAGGGGGGRGGRGAAAAPDPNAAPAAPPAPTPCAGGGGAGGRGFGGGGGGGRGGFGGGIGPGVYRVTLAIEGKDVASQTFSVLEDVWLNER
jgi:hypothetical protein